MVVLLRGINVGGRGRLAMADLRAIAEGCGYQSVRTYIQSGNLVLESESDDGVEVERRLGEAIAESSDVSPSVMVRTATEWRSMIDANPFIRRGEDADYLHVVVMHETARIPESLDVASLVPEEVVAHDRHFYLYLPNGMGRSQLAQKLDRATKSIGTVRNWRTVTTLAGMLDEVP